MQLQGSKWLVIHHILIKEGVKMAWGQVYCPVWDDAPVRLEPDCRVRVGSW